MLKKVFESVNPIEIIQGWILDVCKDLVLSSYWVCIIGGLIGLILYICGLKKAKDLVIISPVIYLIIRILGGVILNV